MTSYGSYKKQIEAHLKVLQAVAVAICDAGDQGLIEGHLYARLISYMDLDSFNKMISILTDTGKNGEPPMVLKKHHVLKWNFEAYPIKKGG